MNFACYHCAETCDCQSVLRLLLELPECASRATLVLKICDSSRALVLHILHLELPECTSPATLAGAVRVYFACCACWSCQSELCVLPLC